MPTLREDMRPVCTRRSKEQVPQDAPYAGGFELSVGAGLISVLFIVAISLTESMRGQEQ